MPKQPRIYLFHGNDSRASSRALSVWDSKFREKFGATTRHQLDADELSPELLEKKLREVLSARGLFPEPSLIILKRLTGGDRGTSSPISQRVTKVFSDLLADIDETVTVALWEEKKLSDRHPLVLWFTEHEGRSQAKVNLHQAPTNENGIQIAEKYLQERGFRLQSPARLWIREQLQWLEKAARGAKRLKAADELAQDERSWWLYQTLDAAMLQAEGAEVGVRELQMGVGEAYVPVSVFECVNAVLAGRYDEARSLLSTWEQGVDDSAYFGLYALLRRQFGDRRHAFALRLLADIEVITKNTQLSHAWLLDMFILRLQQASAEGLYLPIVKPRTLWKGQLPRS